MPPRLTGFQTRILRLLAEGHSVGSSTKTLKVSYQVGKNHLKLAREANCMNTYELIAKFAVEEYQAQAERTA